MTDPAAPMEQGEGAVSRSHSNSLTDSTATEQAGLGRVTSKEDEEGSIAAQRQSQDQHVNSANEESEKESRLQPTISAIGNENGAEIGKDALVLKKEASAGGGEEDQQYITGLKFGLVFLGIVLTCFLILLDTSIIVTVNKLSRWPKEQSTDEK